VPTSQPAGCRRANVVAQNRSRDSCAIVPVALDSSLKMTLRYPHLVPADLAAQAHILDRMVPRASLVDLPTQQPHRLVPVRKRLFFRANPPVLNAVGQRLTHYVEIIPIEGESYRKREADPTQKKRRGSQ
jgi:hypothetical protein